MRGMYHVIEDNSEIEGLRRWVSLPVRSSAEMSEVTQSNPQTPEWTQGQQANNVVEEVEDATLTNRFDGSCDAQFFETEVPEAASTPHRTNLGENPTETDSATSLKIPLPYTV